ncbi:MAG: NAD(P)H-hydrate dehydratase [Desulfovibrio desulfuricans]|nr:NAD(P)H-hydrate dehydratase [Desulfovibrio desulfuricans]
MDEATAQHFPPLPLPEEMRLWDAGAMSLGLPEELLMENAARAALAVLQTYVPRLAGRRVLLFMGGGNNGGDAACLARLLLDQGAEPLVLHTRPLSACRGACGKHVRTARACGVPFRRCPSAPAVPAPTPDILVDGLLGTGFRGKLRSDMLTLVRAMNAMPTPFVLALDIPSGLDGVSGLPSPEAVRATATVSFQAAKPGLLMPDAAPWTGRVHVRDIGIPARTLRAAPCSFHLADGHCLAPLGTVTPGGFKNSYGQVLVIGGAPGFGGAAHLAARAALRSGAGLVTSAAPLSGLADIKNGWAEIMTLPLTGTDAGRWPAALPKALIGLLDRCSALVVGPGMGRGEDAAALLAALLELPRRPPTVFDADALMLLARCPALLSRIDARDVLTPHPGEAAALLGCSVAAVQADRREALTRLCGLCRGTVALKGAGSLVGQANAPTLLCPYDVPQLSVGGSGDVLAGCIGGLLARTARAADGDAAPRAGLLRAGQAVALHALAGRMLGAEWPLRGNTAAALADALPRALAAHALQQPGGDALPCPA